MNVRTGRETKDRYRIERAKGQKRVLIAGGGPGGMEAARVLALRGHKVALYEKEGELGGRLRLAAVPPYKKGYGEAFEQMLRNIRKLNIEVHTGTPVTSKLLGEQRPDVLIVATGSTPIVPAIPGIERSFVVTADDVLAGRVQVGQRVVILGGGSVGAETHEVLAHAELARDPEPVPGLAHGDVQASLRGDGRHPHALTLGPLHHYSDRKSVV